jgi:hypothetical protein
MLKTLTLPILTVSFDYSNFLSEFVPLRKKMISDTLSRRVGNKSTVELPFLGFPPLPFYFTYCVEVSYFNSSVTHAHIPRPMTLSSLTSMEGGFQFGYIPLALLFPSSPIYTHGTVGASHDG